MNQVLHELARKAGLDGADRARLRLAFGLACVERVRHLLESEAVIGVLVEAQEMLAAPSSEAPGSARWQALGERAVQLARSHPGSKSIDGASHAAVSASHAVAQAVSGRALEAAAYAAYAMVYATGGSQVTQPEAFTGEHEWQVRLLLDMLDAAGLAR